MQNKTIVIIEGPSGVGKDTIINTLLETYPDRFGRPINVTTRPMRENESQNNPYYFVTEEEFFRLRNAGDIFEHTMRHGTYRGMRKSSFDSILSQGKIVLRDCDRFGLEALKKIFPNQVIGIFLTCPKAEIRNRLISRNEPKESMERRLKDYDTFVENAKYFDYTIDNLIIDETVGKILNIINKENA